MITAETVKKAMSAIKRAADAEYFFNQLKSPDWVKPLLQEGFFRSPPAPVRDGNYISYPAWPESRYLVRMASVQPETVMEIALQIPDTENARVQDDLIEVALALPPRLTVRLMCKVNAWAQSPRLLLFPEKLGNLISHLARGGQATSALDVARTLLAIVPAPQRNIDLPADMPQLKPQAEARFDTWNYQEILKKNIPDLVTVTGLDALILLCDLLESAITLSRQRAEDSESIDHSYIWRPAIEDNSQNHPHGLRHSLVSAVRDAAEQITKADRRALPALLQILEQRRRPIFHRIGLHLLRVFADTVFERIEQQLTDRTIFDNHTLRHEYYLLLQAQFKNLDGDKKAKILHWIEEGPDLKSLKETQKETRGKELTDEELTKFAHSWRLTRLAAIKADLDSEWKAYYEKWITELGEPDHPEFVSYMTSWVGPTSPKRDEELRSMSVGAVVSFLTNWKPTEEHMAPSPEGLGRVLASVVALDPERFADTAQQFQGLDPTYVRAVISGFRDAVQHNRSFNWRFVLGLCLWVVKQPRQIEGRETEYSDLDPGWVWARKSIAELLEAGFGADQVRIPFDMRELVWQVLQPITEDPEPTPEDETRYAGSNMDPASLSINSTRPQAIHATVRYALWVKRNLEESGDGGTARDFDDMPEAREVLNAHLDPLRDPSLAIRSVYGQWFPWLFLLDPNWATANASKIFPLDESHRELFYAAWNTFVMFCDAYDNVLEVLRPQYAAAVENMGSDISASEQSDHAEERLSEHLMIFFWRGKLGLEDRHGFFARFWSKADDRLAAHAIEFIGRSLSNTEGDVPHDILGRLQELWHQRLELARGSPQPKDHKNELAAFGWWFASGKFDDKWAIAQLKEVVSVVRKIDPDHLVVERLAKIAAEMPADAVECLRLIVDSEDERWGIYSWRDDARIILSTAIAGTNEEAKTAAIDLIHHLGAKGYSDFRAILATTSNS
jgi:hypothetical protein